MSMAYGLPYKGSVKPRIERLFVPNRQLKQHTKLFLL